MKVRENVAKIQIQTPGSNGFIIRVDGINCLGAWVAKAPLSKSTKKEKVAAEFLKVKALRNVSYSG